MSGDDLHPPLHSVTATIKNLLHFRVTDHLDDGAPKDQHLLSDSRIPRHGPSSPEIIEVNSEDDIIFNSRANKEPKRNNDSLPRNWYNVKANLEMGHKTVELPNWDLGTGNISGGGDSPYNIKDPKVDGFGWKVGLSNEPDMRYINRDSKPVPFLYFNFTGFRGTETESAVVVNPPQQSGILTAGGTPAGFVANVTKIENQSKIFNTGSAIEIRNGRAKEISGGIMFEVPLLDTFQSFRTHN